MKFAIFLIGAFGIQLIAPALGQNEQQLTKDKTCRFGGNVACSASCQLSHCDHGDCDASGNCVCAGCLTESIDLTPKDLGDVRDKTCKYGGQTACTASCKLSHCTRGRCDASGNCVCEGCPPPADEKQSLEREDKTCKYGGQAACTASCKLSHCARGRCDADKNCVCEGCPPTPLFEARDKTCKYMGQAGCTSSCKLSHCQRGRCDASGNCVCEGCP